MPNVGRPRGTLPTMSWRCTLGFQIVCSRSAKPIPSRSGLPTGDAAEKALRKSPSRASLRASRRLAPWSGSPAARVRLRDDYERSRAERKHVGMNQMRSSLPRSATAVPRPTLDLLRRCRETGTPACGPDDSPRLKSGERLLIDTLESGRVHTRGDLPAAGQATPNDLRELSRRAAAAQRKLPPRTSFP